jgi:hypothetical protein
MSRNSSVAIRSYSTIGSRKSLSESPIDALTGTLTVTLTHTLAVSAIRKGISAPGKGRISYVSASHVRTPKGATNSDLVGFFTVPRGTGIVISRSLGRPHAEASVGLATSGAIGVLASFSSFGLPSEDDRANTIRISRASGDDGQFGGLIPHKVPPFDHVPQSALAGEVAARRSSHGGSGDPASSHGGAWTTLRVAHTPSALTPGPRPLATGEAQSRQRP